MSPFVDWLRRVVSMGESVQELPPAFTPREQAEALPILRASFDRHALEIAGPPLAFDAPTAIWSAGRLAGACWQLATGSGDTSQPADGREPSVANHHLTADTLLRFLPAVYRRAKARDAAGELAGWLEVLGRRWPLSGVLLDLDGLPTTSPDFDGHAGLQLLYAERLVENPRSGWLPSVGSGLDQVERIFAERGRPMPPLGDARRV